MPGSDQLQLNSFFIASVPSQRNLRERDHLGDPGVDGRIILRWIFGKWEVGA